MKRTKSLESSEVGAWRMSTRRDFVASGAALLAIAVAPRLRAQVQPVIPTQNVRFTVFAAQPIKDLTYVPRTGAQPEKLLFFPTARSARHDYRGPMPMRFTDATMGAVVAEVRIPAGMREALLLFLPPGDAPLAGGLKHRVAVLEDSAARFASGFLAMINFSELSLTGTVGKQNVTVRPGLNPAINIGRGAEVALHTRFKERTYRSYAGNIKLQSRQRALLLLFPPFTKGSLEVQSRLLIDEPAAPPPPPP